MWRETALAAGISTRPTFRLGPPKGLSLSLTCRMFRSAFADMFNFMKKEKKKRLTAEELLRLDEVRA